MISNCRMWNYDPLSVLISNCRMWNYDPLSALSVSNSCSCELNILTD
jgi:hypothetical protein